MDTFNLQTFETLVETHDYGFHKSIPIETLAEWLEMEYREALETAKRIEALTDWQLVIGRRGQKTRLVKRDAAAIAAEPQTVAASDAAAPAQPFYAVRTRTGGPRTTETVEVYFPIRLGQNVALRLPADVTREELDRFALFLKSLPVREPLNDD
ncbi:hypothetical protein [Tistrella mobilis]|uniref:hypothetical protein n=1 Tax=Tistrella mobilis TaxID=171437 RepID=UPI000C0980FA|nr:hypothetical protein [uncultured Tistrella sp.]MAM72190.1 hypothetical protein [Tistrella sp.]